MFMYAIAFLCCCLATGCIGTLDETKGKLTVASPAQTSSPERCQSLSDSQALWGAVGAGSAVLSGASGLSTIAVESNDARLVLGITSLTIGAVGAGSVVLSQAKASAWSGECAK